MTTLEADHTTIAAEPSRGKLVYKQKLATRVTHWVWTVSLFLLLLSGLQIFNAHPKLYVGKQSGFAFENSVLSLDGEDQGEISRGTTSIFGYHFDTTGVLGMSIEDGEMTSRGFPTWATIPAKQDLATGRVIHFFFAWVLTFTLFLWGLFSLINGHAWRDVVPGWQDMRRLPRDILDHLMLRFHKARN